MTTRLIITVLALVTCHALAGDTDLPVSVTIGGRTNDAAGVNKMTFALTNLTTKPQHYQFIALEPRGAGGAWLDARTQSDGAASSHYLAAGATTNLTVRPPRGADEWRLQFWFTPVGRSAKQVTMRTDKIVER